MYRLRLNADVLQEPQPQYDAAKEDYEADFESDEYYDNIDNEAGVESEEEDEEKQAANQRQAWLMEQAERGRARQKALMNRIEDESQVTSPGPGPCLQQQRTFQEKESSRDSAYGYSADSRIPTREPTPDYRMMSSQNRRILVNFKSKKEPRKKESEKENKTEYDKNKSQLKFLTEVTRDILSRGIFSEKGLRSAINSQVCDDVTL